jgi:hypothetical protein
LSALKRENTNYKKESIGITVVAVAIASFLLVGTILTPTQASALSKFNTNTGTSNLKHAIRDGVSVNLEHRDQHMNQENLCYRTNTCRQSNTGQNTLGNDNSVTGFADQSDNLQQSAAVPIIPSTANQTTGNQTTGNQTTGNQTTPAPIPTACPVGTIFDVTLQANLGAALATLPAGTVLCLNTAGLNTGITAILPGGTTTTVTVTVSSVVANNQCPAGSVVALVTSGTLPLGLSGTTVCVS